MSYGHHRDGNFTLVYLINDAVIAYPNAVSFFSFQFNMTLRPGIIGKSGNCLPDNRDGHFVQLNDLLLGVTFNKYEVSYLTAPSISLKACSKGIGSLL